MEQKFNTMTVNIYSEGLVFSCISNSRKILVPTEILKDNNWKRPIKYRYCTMLYFMYNEDCNRVVRTTKSGRKWVPCLSACTDKSFQIFPKTGLNRHCLFRWVTKSIPSQDKYPWNKQWSTMIVLVFLMYALPKLLGLPILQYQ